MNAFRTDLQSLIVKAATPELEAIERKMHGNGFKTHCTSAILSFFGIEKSSYRFCQCVNDMIRIFNRNGWRAQNVGVKKESKKAIGGSISNLSDHVGRGFYLIHVSGHVLLVYVSDEGSVSISVGSHSKFNDLEILSVHKITLKK